MSIICDDYDCAHNQEGACRNNDVVIEMKFGEFRDGNRICYHDCRDYKGCDRDG